MWIAPISSSVLKELRNAQALRTGEGEVDLARDVPLEKRQVLAAADARNQQMQVMDFLRIYVGKGAGKKIGLLLIIPLQRQSVAGLDQDLQGRFDLVRRKHLAVGKSGRAGNSSRLVQAALVPSLRDRHVCGWLEHFKNSLFR